MSKMKKILAYFGRSRLAKALLRSNGFGEPRLLALKQIGKTRFGSHYSAADSLIPCLDKIQSLVQEKQISFKVCDFQTSIISYTLSTFCIRGQGHPEDVL